MTIKYEYRIRWKDYRTNKIKSLPGKFNDLDATQRIVDIANAMHAGKRHYWIETIPKLREAQS